MNAHLQVVAYLERDDLLADVESAPGRLARKDVQRLAHELLGVAVSARHVPEELGAPRSVVRSGAAPLLAREQLEQLVLVSADRRPQFIR